MMITSFHLPTVSSTQSYLKEYLLKNQLTEGPFLCSTNRQTQGRGRGEKVWDNFEKALAFSFTLAPTSPISLTTLEVAVLLLDFFKERSDLGVSPSSLALKWPNDLLNCFGHKWGGLLGEVLNPDQLLLGVGLNLFQNEKEEKEGLTYQTRATSLNLSTDLEEDYKEKLPLNIYNYLLTHRLTGGEICKKWNESCLHLHKKVLLKNEFEEYRGSFCGIGPSGEAIIDERTFMAGHLFIEDVL